MKISKSKQELARIISENGGWRDWEFAVQDGYDTFAVWFFAAKPVRVRGAWLTDSDSCQREIDGVAKIPNWHQTVLSRAEYFHLYPAPDDKPRICESVMRSIPEPTAKPTIEQLTSDYRNAKDYAERKQQEADDAKADADARLKALELAGEAIGLTVSPITAKKEPELVINGWWNLLVGDVVELISFQGGSARVGEIGKISKFFGNGYFQVDFPSQSGYSVDHSHIKFIRRP